MSIKEFAQSKVFMLKVIKGGHVGNIDGCIVFEQKKSIIKIHQGAGKIIVFRYLE